MNAEESVLLRITQLLDRIGIPYMVTGSFASSHHGRPRTTHDADIVIDPAADSLDGLVRELIGMGFYVDPDRARDALARRRPFNTIEIESGWKIDLIIRKDRPFSQEELRRRRPAEIAEGLRVALATPEDTILSKLEWAKKGGGSERQLSDAAAVLEINPRLDRAYIERWASELGVLDLWEQVVRGRG